jgi:hypothetical protein
MRTIIAGGVHASSWRTWAAIVNRVTGEGIRCPQYHTDVLFYNLTYTMASWDDFLSSERSPTDSVSRYEIQHSRLHVVEPVHILILTFVYLLVSDDSPSTTLYALFAPRMMRFEDFALNRSVNRTRDTELCGVSIIEISESSRHFGWRRSHTPKLSV